MVGIGKWKFTVDTFLYRGSLFLNISQEDGSYVFRPEIPDYNGDISYDILEAKETGNTLHVVAAASMIPGNKMVSADLTFDGDRCIATLDLPFLGKMELKDGVKIS